MITIPRGDLTILANLGGVQDLVWKGESMAKFIAGRRRVNETTFKRTPTRQPPAEMVSYLESIGQIVDFVDVAEEEVP